MQELNQTRQAELLLSPEGHVYINDSFHANEYLSKRVFEKLQTLFTKSSSLGLLHLGIQEFTVSLPSSFIFWQSFSRKFVVQVCKLIQTVENQDFPPIPIPGKTELQEVINQAIFIKGMEYLSNLSLEFLCGH
jgi:hypothetical protein